MKNILLSVLSQVFYCGIAVLVYIICDNALTPKPNRADVYIQTEVNNVYDVEDDLIKNQLNMNMFRFPIQGIANVHGKAGYLILIGKNILFVETVLAQQKPNAKILQFEWIPDDRQQSYRFWTTD